MTTSSNKMEPRRRSRSPSPEPRTSRRSRSPSNSQMEHRRRSRSPNTAEPSKNTKSAPALRPRRRHHFKSSSSSIKTSHVAILCGLAFVVGMWSPSWERELLFVGDQRKIKEPKPPALPLTTKRPQTVQSKPKQTDTKKKKKKPTTDDNQKVNEDGQLWIKPDYLQHLQSLPPMPRRVHVFFPHKDFVQQQQQHVAVVQHGTAQLIQQNPDWNVSIYDEDDLNRIILAAGKTKKDGVSLSAEEIQLLLGKEQSDSKNNSTAKTYVGGAHFAEKSDLARLLVMYNVGGVFVNFDRLVNVPLNKVFPRTNQNGTIATKLCLPTLLDINFMQSLMCSAPGNQLFAAAIRLASAKRAKPLPRRGGWLSKQDVFSLGPPIYNEAVSAVVFDGPIGPLTRGTSKDAMKRHMALARKVVTQQKPKGLIVTAKDEGCESLLSQNEKDGSCPSMNRKGLYDAYHMKPFPQEIQERWDQAEPAAV